MQRSNLAMGTNGCRAEHHLMAQSCPQVMATGQGSHCSLLGSDILKKIREYIERGFATEKRYFGSGDAQHQYNTGRTMK